MGRGVNFGGWKRLISGRMFDDERHAFGEVFFVI